MKNRLTQCGAGLAALIFLPASAGVAASGSAESAATYLTFETKLDGRCQNLSEGGKLAVMHNTHPDRKIDFRLIRYYVDVPQQGRATGTADAGGATVKLGCSRVGGRQQRWVLERATFNQESD